MGDLARSSYAVVEGVEGPRITKFSARDKDSEENGELWFSIIKGNDNELFEISHSEGVFRVKSGQSLDREKTPYHHLRICVSDKGDIPLNNTVCNFQIFHHHLMQNKY